MQDARREGNGYAVYCSHTPVHDRGAILNAPLLTLTFRAPRPGILALTLTHFQGTEAREPAFELFEQPSALAVTEAEDRITLTSGSLSAVITRRPFSLAYYENGVRLTGLGDRHMGYAKTPEGAYLRVKLPADGSYTVHVGDAQHSGGEAYAYRLRLSAPQPEVQDRAYAAAVVLTVIVLVLSLTGRYIMRHFSKNKIS